MIILLIILHVYVNPPNNRVSLQVLAHIIPSLLRKVGTLVQWYALDQLCRQDSFSRQLWKDLRYKVAWVIGQNLSEEKK